MASLSILTVADALEALILAVDGSHFTEHGADQITFKLPQGRQSRALGERSFIAASPSAETRKFVVIPGKGGRRGRWDGTEAPAENRLEVRIHYYVPPSDAEAERHIERMAAADSEHITQLVETQLSEQHSFIGPWAAIGPGSHELEEEPGSAPGLKFLRLFFEGTYHYDGT